MEKSKNSRTTISMPEEIAERLEERKSPRQPWSGVIEEMLDQVEN